RDRGRTGRADPAGPGGPPARVVALVPRRAAEPVRGLHRPRSRAASIRNFEPVVVPGLLQTADYAREIFRNGPIELDPDEVERLLEVRLARQEILARDDRPRLWVVIDEAVIHRVVGSVSVMRGQLRHLVES